MGDSKLCLLLLLSTSALTFAQDRYQPTCLLAQRYKSLHKYEYQYEAESLNAINGASHLKNGHKASCKVEIEVPQTCNFIVRTTGCRLSEVVDTDAQGNPVFANSPSSDAFAAEMEKYPLRVVIEGLYDVKLYPEDGETTTVLNFKRGIISALAVPVLEEDKNKNMPTIHGNCKTHYTVNAREDIATDVSLNRDLSRCDKFVPMRDHTSPLALITGMHYPLAQLIRSSQSCNYRFDNEKKHMTFGSCTENHILIPFSYKREYGVANVGKQELTLVKVSPHNDRIFVHGVLVKDLHMEAVEDKSFVQDKDAVLNLLRELDTLPENEGEKRAPLFHKLVSTVRGMKTETLSAALPEALAVSRVLTYQVLAQCGTPECSSAIMKILRTFDTNALEVDATVFALGLVSNPSALLIHDMLEMAKYKPSKPVMYALSNVVKRFYKSEGKQIPEIHSVAEFMASQLGDCSGDKDKTFMTLRVIGNMAPAVVPASPALRTAVINCVNKPTASLAVQQAAIQVYRLTPLPEEGREEFMQVLLDSTSPMQKRIAAYLVLMKNPQLSELARMVNALPNIQDQQVKSFVISHITNILSSSGSETQALRQKLQDAIQGNEIGPIMDPTKFSRNYKFGSLEGNMIFEGTSYLPKEVMLEMTLKAFGYDIDMVEIGMEGTGFEPTVEALFGENGFFPDTAMQTMYFVSDNMPQRIREVMQNVIPAFKTDRINRQVFQNLMKEIGQNLNKLVRELKTMQSPEAMVYLRLLGNELGYLNTNEMEEIAYSAATMINNMLKMFPTDILLYVCFYFPQLIRALMVNSDNTIFAHYIFMDNEFFLPTVTGVPLRIALSGTFTPGIKGGLRIARDMSEVTFMPSAGIEFATQIGSHIPEYVNSGLEMHTNFFHESGLNAKITFGRDNIKLTIPAPTSPTKLIKITNNLVAVTGSEVKTIPPIVRDKVDVSECSPAFVGMKYCTALQYIDASSQETVPYFPLTGDSKYVVELHPTGEVSEYTATIAYELLSEGDNGRQKVDSLKFILKADGAEPTEARAVMKYNRRRHVISADIQIPDYDVEAGVRLGVVDGNTKGRGTHTIFLDFLNKNVPQLSLVGRANLKAMKEGMLQVQLVVPSISAEATVTATMKRDEEVELELESEIKVMDANSQQKINIKYDATKIEVEVKSDVNAKTTMLPKGDLIKNYGNDLLDMQVGQTDMKVRHIFKKFVEAANNYMEKYGADFPYIRNFRLPDMPEISLPETLFLNTEATAIYYINNNRFTIAIPVPLGGKSKEELNFPPLFGRAEVSTVMKSNLYDTEVSVAFGVDQEESQSYSANFVIKGTSPIDILSIKLEGSGKVATTDSIKAQFESSLAHKFVEARISIVEDAIISDAIHLKTNTKIEARSPLGLSVVTEHTGMAGINHEEMSVDNKLQVAFEAGPIYGRTLSLQSLTIFPFRPEVKFDSNFQVDSTLVKALNVITGTYISGEVSVVSNTSAFDVITHNAELSIRDSRVKLICAANALAFGMKMQNQMEASAGAGEVILRMETNTDHSENHVYSLLTASLDVNGLAINSDANVKLLENEATHKVILRMNKDGFTTKGTTTLHSPLSMENTFDAEVDATRATLSITNRAAMYEIKVDNTNNLTITLSGLNFNSKAEASARDYASYTHDITFDLNPHSVSSNVNNNLNLLSANFINQAQLQAGLGKLDLSGVLKANNGEEELKHTYQISYGDMSANAKCSTTGKFLGTHMSHNTEVEVVGLAAMITNDVRFHSQPVRLSHTVRCNIAPFDFNLDAILNAEGDMAIYGRESAQIYNKFLFRAQPMVLASSNEGRASVTHQLNNGFSLETTFDNKMVTTLSLQEQKTSFKFKSKMNEHTFDQNIEVYNTAETTGIEVSSTIVTNIINTASTDNQEFTVSGLLKYDKNTDSHIIQIPNLLALLEHIKGFFVNVADALHHYINNDSIRAKVEALPQHISDLLTELNIEGKIIQLKEFFSHLIQKYTISMNDVETFLRNLNVTIKKLLANLSVYIQNFVDVVNETIFSGNFPETTIQAIQEWLNNLNEEYDIEPIIVYATETIGEIIQVFDLERLKGSSFAFLHDIAGKDEIKAKLQSILRGIKETLEIFVAELKSFTSSLKAHIELLTSYIPTNIVSPITDFIQKIIQDFDIVNKINTITSKLSELIAKLEADKNFQAILDKAVEVVKKIKIDETITNLATDIIKCYRFLMDSTEFTIYHWKTTEVKEIIQEINMFIEMIVEELKSFDYNNLQQFVDLSVWIMNEIIRKPEILQLLGAIRDFVNAVLLSVRDLSEHLREIKVAEVFKTLMDIFDEVVIIELIDLILNFKISMFDMDAFFGDLTMNYFPSIPEVTLPEITLPQISFPKIPQVPTEKLAKFLQVPEISLPTIPTEIVAPSFGKLFGELKLQTPIYTMETSAEFKNATENAMTPQFKGFFTSIGNSPNVDILNYKLDSTARIAIPKMRRVVFGETVKFRHNFLGAEHQASVTLYGLSAQAQAKTEIKVTTRPYTSTFVNTAFIAREGGMTASLDTTYTHLVDIQFDKNVIASNEVALKQKSLVRQDGYTLTLTADNTGTFNGDDSHNSKLELSFTPSIVTISFSGDTDCSMLKMKQHISAEVSTFSYFKFNVRNEAEAPIIKNSLFVGSGYANLHDMKVELKANKDTELYGAVTGRLSNAISVIAHPGEFFFDFQNKGNVKVNSFEFLTAKIELQNDYLAHISPDSQKMNTVILTRFNQYKILYNFTLENNVNEVGIFAAMESEASLDFLKYPISIPEIDLPFVDFHTPAINDLNLYDQAGLDNILTTTDQSLDVNTKIVYQKSKAAPLADMMGLIQIPCVGNLITELSVKSAIINLIANARMYTEDDLVFRIEATTTSMFEDLQVKLAGTTSLTTKRGFKMANSLSLENTRIAGTHDSTISLSADTYDTEVSVATIANIALPILNMQANQKLDADTKTKANAISTLRISGNLNIPVIKTVGRAEADHSLKLEGTSDYISMESSTRANMDGTVYEDYLLYGLLDNEANVFLNKDALRSTSKVIIDTKFNHGTTKVIDMDVNENLSIEASMSHLYAVLKYTGNNEANLFNFNTKGKHIAQAKMDFAPASSLTVDIDIDVSQPTNMGDFGLSEKTVVEVTAAKQHIFTNSTLVSPLYTTSMAAEVESRAPVIRAVAKSSATSAFVILEYNMDASSTVNFENEAFNMISQITLTHADLTVNANHAIMQAMRSNCDFNISFCSSVQQHALNVDFTSHTFTDVNLQYATRSNGISASVSSPATGLLGLQFSRAVPSQMSAKVYGRYPSAPEVDVDILVIRSTPKDNDKMNLQIVYNMETPTAILSLIKMRLPSIISTFKEFTDKYQFTGYMEMLKDSVINHINEVYNAATNYDVQMSQLSILFRNIIVQYQKTVQVFLNAVIKVLRETRFKVPGSDELTTLPEVLKKLTSSIAAMLEATIQIIYENMEAAYNFFVERLSNVKMQMPVGDAVTGGQIIDQVKKLSKKIFEEMVNFVKNMESLDTMLVKIDETLEAIVEKSQEFVDSLKSDYLDAMFVNINHLYRNFVTVLKNIVDRISAFAMEFNMVCDYIINVFMYVVHQFNNMVHGVLQQASEEVQAHVTVRDGKLEIDLPFHFQQ
ncbi:apolipoprotein Bb, tandem duplicate 1 [Pelmatolapia mariae]|uniref:apolipoprotein Bb, tandem duplicate 1 n=1 Tax=Pelmatolapia mariae TaxID=158779 RepID=UPI002FE673FA